jgi:hypothetical protein
MGPRPDRRDKAAMGRWLGVPPHDPAAGTTVGVVIMEGPMMSGKKAPETAVYLLNGMHIRVRGGDLIPDGAVLRGDPADAEAVVEPEAEPVAEPAPEPAKKAAKVGPTETAKSAGPDETS